MTSAIKPRTLETYQKARSDYIDFAIAHGLSPLFPVSSTDLGYYVAYLFSQKKPHGSIMGQLSAISYFHKIDNLADPQDCDFIKKLTTSIKKLLPSVDHRQAVDLRVLDLLLIELGNMSLSSYDQSLYSAMFLLSYWGCLRVGEIVKSNSKENVIQFHQLKGHVKKGKVTGFTLKFESYKHSHTITKPSQDKPVLPSLKISEKPKLKFCPVKWLTKYLALRGNSPGQFFLHQDGAIVTYDHFSKMMKKCLSLANFEPKLFGTHSFRIGRTTDLSKQGFSDTEIRIMGRWKSDAFKTYIRPNVIYV